MPFGVDDLSGHRTASHRTQKQLVVGLTDGHDPYQPLLDGDPEVLLVNDLVPGVRPGGEGELHRVPSAEHPDPGIWVEPPGRLVGSAEYLDRAVRELDHRVVIVP